MITESQHGRGWQGPQGVPQPNPLPKQGHPEQGAQHRVQGGWNISREGGSFLWRQSGCRVRRAVPSTSRCSARRELASEWGFFDVADVRVLSGTRGGGARGKAGVWLPSPPLSKGKTL